MRKMPKFTPSQIKAIADSRKGQLPAFIRALQMTKPSKGAGELFIRGTREQFRKNSSK